MHTYVEQTIRQIGRAAGLRGWMHLDAAGVVRVGAGMALADEGAAIRLPFQVGMRAATQQEIGADYTRVRAMMAARRAEFYRRASGPLLEQEVIDALLRTSLVGLQVELREVVPGFDGLRDEVKCRLLGVCYVGGAEAARRRHTEVRSGGGLRELGFGLVGLVCSLLERGVRD